MKSRAFWQNNGRKLIQKVDPLLDERFAYSFQLRRAKQKARAPRVVGNLCLISPLRLIEHVNRA
jgi:hypothetical protein